MSWADVVNGSYESVGAVMMLLNCLRPYQDKEVKGVSIVATVFFTTWGYWNLYYYPSLHQWMSFLGGAMMAIGNSVWVGLAIYYTTRNRRRSLGPKCAD